MKERGDPTRRGADHGEAFGASIKDSLHRRTLRRKKAVSAAKELHVKRNAAGEVIKSWEQKALGVSRVMQVWRDMIVQSKLLRDEKSTPYLQRGHVHARTTGYATVGAAAAASAPKGVPVSIQAKIQETRDLV